MQSFGLKQTDAQGILASGDPALKADITIITKPQTQSETKLYLKDHPLDRFEGSQRPTNQQVLQYVYHLHKIAQEINRPTDDRNYDLAKDCYKQFHFGPWLEFKCRIRNINWRR